MLDIVARRAGGVFAVAVAVVVAPAPVDPSPNAHSAARLTARPAAVVLAGSSYRQPSSPCYRPRRTGRLVNFYGVGPRWRHCPWLVVPVNETASCPQYSAGTCPTMWDVSWRRWRHRRAVGVGWIVQPHRPKVMWWAKVSFSQPVLGYTRTGRAWMYTRSHVQKLGAARPRTLLQRATTYLMGKSDAGRTHCISVFRTEHRDKDKVGWTYHAPGRWRYGFGRNYGIWLGRAVNHHWRGGRLLGWSEGPRASIRVDAQARRLRVQSRARSSPWLQPVPYWQFAATCPLD